MYEKYSYVRLLRDLFLMQLLFLTDSISFNISNRELNKYRVQVMNEYRNKKGPNYTNFKNNWKVLLGSIFVKPYLVNTDGINLLRLINAHLTL